MCNESWCSSGSIAANLFTFSISLSVIAGILNEILQVTCCKAFLSHQDPGFSLHVLHNACANEKEGFMKHVKSVPIDEVSVVANLISSHTVYKNKFEENDALRLQARIVRHGNIDSIKCKLKCGWTMCPLLWFCIVTTVCNVNHWIIVRADVKAVFFKASKASLNVYVRLLHTSKDSLHYWLFLAAFYGFVDANVKF